MPEIDLEFLKQLKEDYRDYKVFVESGTGNGDTIISLEPEFAKLYTFEITEKYYTLSKNKYNGNKINFNHGDSYKKFKELLPDITEKAIFFLDGHYSSGDTGRGEKDVPLLEELAVINDLFKNDAIIIIDNYRLFGKGPKTGLNEDWVEITKENIFGILKNRITAEYHLDGKIEYMDRLVIHIRKQYQIAEKNVIKGVVCLLYGGLGNQLFQALAGYIVNKTKGLPVHLLKNSTNVHNNHKFNYYDIFLKNFGTELVIDNLNFLSFMSKEYKILSPKTPYSNWNATLAENGTVLTGFYQYYPAIEPYEKEIRNILLLHLERYRGILLERLNFQQSAFLHVRRGDYVNNRYHKKNDIDNYYKMAEAALIEKTGITKIYVLSDDLEWVISQDFFCRDLYNVFKGNEIESLALMSLCTGGAICANSTFSWWGGFLGAYAHRNPVIVPKAWASHDATNLIPKEWIVI